MKKHKTLNQLLDDMQSAVSCGDEEIAHDDADRILTEVILKLADLEKAVVKTRLLKIIELYEKVDKWYA